MEKSVFLVILACLLWATPSFGAAAASPDDADSAWVAHAVRLVHAAVTGTAPIADFRRQVVDSRKRLRRIFLANMGKGSGTRRALHMQMLVLNSLLQAAASCHQGGTVSCPPTLISQLINERDIVQRLAGKAETPDRGAGL
ncbi:MAG: hypothetical protein P8180_03890 [Gammaproteobacteria bacterium]